MIGPAIWEASAEGADPSQSGKRQGIGYAAVGISVAALALFTHALYTFVDPIAGTMAMLVIVLFASLRFGLGPALCGSLLGTAYLNYFFIPPFLRLSLLHIDDTAALVVFLTTSMTVAKLSDRAQQRSKDAERSRIAAETLYLELRTSIDRSAELEALRRSERLKTELLNTVTHNLRTPLTSIKIAATMLRSGIYETESRPALRPPVREELLDVVIAETDRLNHFVEEMLQTARLRVGDFGNSELTGSAEDVINLVMRRSEKVLTQHRLAINFDCSKSVQLGSAPAVVQILSILVENAAKYSPPQTSIVVSIRKSEDIVEFAVVDEGPGIPPEYRERIFERFFHVSPPGAVETNPSLGMGLAIARGLANGIGGRIWLDSSSDKGARFCFAVPVASMNQAAVGNGN